MDECVKTKVICNRCNTKSVLEVFEDHDCVIGFINQVKTDDANSFKIALTEMQARFDEKLTTAEKRF